MKWIMQGKRMEQENPIFPEGKKKNRKISEASLESVCQMNLQYNERREQNWENVFM